MELLVASGSVVSTSQLRDCASAHACEYLNGHHLPSSSKTQLVSKTLRSGRRSRIYSEAEEISPPNRFPLAPRFASDPRKPGLIERALGSSTIAKVGNLVSEASSDGNVASPDWLLPGDDLASLRDKTNAALASVQDPAWRDKQGRELKGLIEQLEAIRMHALDLERRNKHHYEHAHVRYQLSARNMLHYLALRNLDIRKLQNALANLGLSSLGRTEAHTMASIQAVTRVLRSMLREISPNSSLKSFQDSQLLGSASDGAAAPNGFSNGFSLDGSVPASSAAEIPGFADLPQIKTRSGEKAPSASSSPYSSPPSSPTSGKKEKKEKKNKEEKDRSINVNVNYVMDFHDGDLRLANHTEDLLGPFPTETDRTTHIMVTLPTEASTDRQLVMTLLQSGMNVARVNCAHDDPAVWSSIIANVRNCSIQLGKSCRILMDLAGPKLRTGPLEDGPRVQRLKVPKNAMGRKTGKLRLWLAPAGVAPPAADASGAALKAVPLVPCVLAVNNPSPEKTLQEREGRGAPAALNSPASEAVFADPTFVGKRLSFVDARGKSRSFEIREMVLNDKGEYGWVAEADKSAVIESGMALVVRTMDLAGSSSDTFSSTGFFSSEDSSEEDVEEKGEVERVGSAAFARVSATEAKGAKEEEKDTGKKEKRGSSKGKQRKGDVQEESNKSKSKVDALSLAASPSLLTSEQQEESPKNVDVGFVVGELPPLEQAIVLSEGDELVLVKGGDDLKGRRALYDTEGFLVSPAFVSCDLDQLFTNVKVGEVIKLDDGKIEGVVSKVNSVAERVSMRITKAAEGGSKLKGEKAINLPESNLLLQGLTVKDICDLDFIAANADMVAFSFVNDASDVLMLQDELRKRGNSEIGVVLKIETKKGFQNLPWMLLQGMRSAHPLGVMIARGDLAVECGWLRLAEIQEEILWLCEAAHVPTIWATQVLEGLAKVGLPSRAEITDAAMGQRAECVMLNKGPHITQAVEMLDGILSRMHAHQAKKQSMLRPLRLSHKFAYKSQALSAHDVDRV